MEMGFWGFPVCRRQTCTVIYLENLSGKEDSLHGAGLAEERGRVGGSISTWTLPGMSGR